MREVERIFGFKAKDPALVWQALQFKNGSLAETRSQGFNKPLALKGDAALRSAMIEKADRDPSTRKSILSIIYYYHFFTSGKYQVLGSRMVSSSIYNISSGNK